MYEDEFEVHKELDLIWLDCPAFLINWLRDNINEIEIYKKDVNRLIEDIIDIIN